MSYLDIYKAGIFAYSAANFVTVMPEHVKIYRNYRYRKKMHIGSETYALDVQLGGINVISNFTITFESKFSSSMNVKVKGVTQLRS